ncbi:MAG: hypothetical protein RI886_1210 [Pseudomonadota bacterium]|jgi:oligoribonuclease
MVLKKSNKNLIWIDLEMTGLDPEKERIIEIATIITDKDLNILEEGPNLVIHQPKELLSTMDDWNQNQHKSSGLLAKVKSSPITEQIAEIETLDFISRFVGEGKSPMCGNTVSHDRRFLAKYMPGLESYFHYRHIDVSTIKELIARWLKSDKLYKKSSTHRAQDDIRESIKELKFYKDKIFRA